MKTRSVFSLIICSVCFSAPTFGNSSVFQSTMDSSVQLNAAETAKYQHIKHFSGALQTKLISINENSFSQGSVQLELFDGVQNNFEVQKDEHGTVWKGKGTNLDRFVIQKINGKYSGQILYKGRQYVLTPVKEGVSALYEMTLDIKCGMDALKRTR